MGRRQRLFAVLALISAPAFAAGFGVELGAGVSNTLGPVTPTFDVALDARIPSEVMGALELRTHNFFVFLDAGVATTATLLPRYRTPFFNVGAFAFSFAGGIGALMKFTCGGGACGFDGGGPVIEISPTLSLQKSDLFQPYVAINGAIASVWTQTARVVLSGSLVLGVAFDFGPPRKKTTEQPLLPAVPTTPVQPTSGDPENATPTLAPTNPVTPPQDEKPAPAPPTPNLIPKEEDPANLPPPSLIPASAPATAPSP